MSTFHIQNNVSQFSISKIGEDKNQNYDSLNWSKKFHRFALADGVSGASYSKEWSDILTNGFIEKSFPENDFELKDWITPLQLTWYHTVPWDRLEDPKNPSYMAEKAREGGAATFLGGIFDVRDEKITLKIWALGDTNLFLVRDSETIFCFPLTTSEEFGIDPDMFFSLPKEGDDSKLTKNFAGNIKYKEIEIQKDDMIICASDAISKWYIDSLDNPSILPWIELDQITNEDEFVEFISDKVKCKNMKNDDSTLFILRF